MLSSQSLVAYKFKSSPVTRFGYPTRVKTIGSLVLLSTLYPRISLKPYSRIKERLLMYIYFLLTRKQLCCCDFRHSFS